METVKLSSLILSRFEETFCKNAVLVLQVILAEGEMKASRSLKEAADIMSESPAAMQIRYLQTLNSIAAERNSTIIFPLPIDMLNQALKK